MYFEIQSDAAATTDWERLLAALRAADPFADLHVEPQHGRVRVGGALSRNQVLETLRGAGFAASHLPHERGGSTCCGSCG